MPSSLCSSRRAATAVSSLSTATKRSGSKLSKSSHSRQNWKRKKEKAAIFQRPFALLVDLVCLYSTDRAFKALLDEPGSRVQRQKISACSSQSPHFFLLASFEQCFPLWQAFSTAAQWPDHSLFLGTVLCTGECLLASLTFAY